MASSSVRGDCKHSRTHSKDGHPASAESSLTWCLAHLYKPGPEADHQAGSLAARDTDKKSKVSQWRALVAIRTQHIKGDKAGIARFRGQGGLRPLLNLLKQPECSRKTLDLALSILANCCTELETRVEVRKLQGINTVVDIMKRNVALESVQNRAARALGNLAMDPESSALIHSAGGVPLLLLCVSLSSAPSSPSAASPSDPCPKLECAQSAARALLYLSDSPSNRLSLLTQGALSALAPLIAPEYPHGLRRAALRTLHELTRGCGVECAKEVSRSGVLAQLGVMASGESDKPFEELALKTLANLCSQGCMRPLVGSLGVIGKFTEEVKRDSLKSGVFFKALCLCCKEAVNRAKVKESGGLEVLIKFLSSYQSHPLSRLAILACVDFVFDESAMEQLQEFGLVPLLVARLVKLTRGEEKVDGCLPSNMSPNELLPSSCLESFDFPPPEGFRREQGSSSFLSLRSWLLSEGLISSEGELLDSSSVDADWGGSQVPPASSPNPSSSPSLKSSSSSNSSGPPKKASSSPSSSLTDPPPKSQNGSSTTSSPDNPSQTPVSPTKFSSPQKRRRAPPAASATQVAVESPPPAPRSAAYHHPYHPEPWTPESPILLLLSRFSHAGDPSAALVSPGVVSGLLFYLTQHQDPSSRCFRMLCRLSCNPNCLQALLRTGSVSLIRHHLCLREEGSEGRERQTDRVKARVKQLGEALLRNLRVQCESGFGSGVLAHVMLSGSESDRINCALSLPFISSNKSLLRKLLLDSGGLRLALRPLGSDDDDDDDEEEEEQRCGRLLSDLFNSPHPGVTSQLHSLYFSLLTGCLSALMSTVQTHQVKQNTAGGDSPPPVKRPRLAAACPYEDSDFDLVLQLDDGTRVRANREAVAGLDGSDGAGSEYFRALLRGGFGEAQGGAEEAIRIKDVSAGMLLPVLHYLHGCRLGRGPQCPVLDILVHDGLVVFQDGAEPLSAEGFQNTPLGEVMVGACRFLVAELQRELEEVLVSFLSSCSTNRHKPASTGDNAEKTESKMDKECREPAEENLASLTSELELTGRAKKLKTLLQQAGGEDASFAGTIQDVLTGLNTSLDKNTIKKVISDSKPVLVSVNKSLDPEEKPSGPKNSVKLVSAAGSEALAALLPRLYCFSQRYNYPSLGRACLSLLLGCQDGAADCLRRLAREADSREALKQDLLGLVSAALI
ncbi:armadillo repeat-containing protein 5 [Kryptolebias marmoratus]|uniref:Armadillo repeat containing 5 n=1 Tax=Kryptolebias marmoratus TaxID=37003 RepID=A0A3Q3A728_KRYMA|nr:armadillo repeat-containing protein 5 [Kryptolebias marmoratus]